MPNCIIATGNIGCGKSTISKHYVGEGYVVISRDQLRYGIGNGKYIYDNEYEPIIFKTEEYLLKEFVLNLDARTQKTENISLRESLIKYLDVNKVPDEIKKVLLGELK